MNKYKKKAINLSISTLIVFAIWILLSKTVAEGKMGIPTPIEVFKALVELINEGLLFNYIGISLYRFLVGYLSAVVVAVILGLILGWYRKAFDIIDPILQLLRPISPTAWFPFIVIFFGIGNLPAIVIIFLSSFYTMLLSTASAIRKLDNSYIKVAQSFEIKGIKLMLKIILPAIFPFIANSLHIALGSAWIFLVAGEMVGAQSGLGYLIIDARNNLRCDMLLLGIILIGIIGLILDKLIGKFEKAIIKKWGN